MPNRTVTVELKALVSSYVAGMKQAGSATKEFADKGKKYVEDHSAELSHLGMTAAAAGAAIVLGVGKAVKTYADFDKEMSRVRSTGDDARQSIDDLRSTAMKLGADTQYSAREAAQGITDMLKAGMAAKDVIGGGLAGALALAASDQLDVAFAAETTAVALQQFKMEGTQATHVADLLAAGAGKAMGGVTELAQALKYVGPVAAGMNISIEETIGTLSAFASEGILADQAGTSLRGVLSSLTSPSSAARKELERLGVTLYDQEGKFLGVANMAGQLETAYQDASDAEKDMSLGILFGNQQITAARILLKQGAAGIQEWTDKVNDAGFAQRQAAEMTNNLAGDIERLGGSIDTVFIQGGSGANNVLRQMAQGAESVVDWVGQLPAPLLETLTVLTGAGGIATLGVGAVLKLVTVAAEARRNFRLLGVAAGTAKVAVAGVGAALAVGTIALTAWAASAADARTRANDLASTMVYVAGEAQKTSATTQELIATLTGDGGLTAANGLAKSLGISFEATSVAAEKLGLTTADLLDYLAKTGPGVVKVNDALAAHDNWQAWIDGGDELRGTAMQVRQDLGVLADGLSEGERQTVAAGRANEAAAVSTKNYAQAALETTDTNKDGAASFSELATSASKAANALLQASGSHIGMEAAIDDAAKALKENGRTLDLNTAKGRANQAALDTLASSTLAYRDSLIATERPAAEVEAANKRGRDAWLKTAVAMGMGSTEAKALADELFAIPKDIEAVVKTTLDREGIKGWNDWTPEEKIAHVKVLIRQGKIQADGGVWEHFAAGGTRDLSQIRPFQGDAGVNWGEKGSGPWEAFISGAPQKRDRSLAIWREVGRRLGATEALAAAFADGGISEPTYLGKSLSYWADQLRTPLELTRLQIQVRDLKADLAAREKYKDRGRTKTRDKLRGLDRTEAKQQLVEAQTELDLALTAQKLNADRLGTIADRLAGYEQDQATARSAESRAGLATGLATDLRRGTLAEQVRSGGGLGVVDQLLDWSGNEALTAEARARLAETATGAESALLALYDQMDAAKDKVAQLEQVASQVKSAVGGFDLASAMESTWLAHSDERGNSWYTEQTASAASITAAAQAKVAKARGFASKIRQLLDAGMSAAVIQDIARMGIDAGSLAADAFLADAGQIADLNTAYADLEVASGQIAQFVTEASAEGGLAAAQALVDSLTSQADQIGQTLASALVSALADSGTPLPGRASGGSVLAGHLYQVNELGVEAFQPAVDGYVLSASQVRDRVDLPGYTGRNAAPSYTTIYQIGEVSYRPEQLDARKIDAIEQVIDLGINGARMAQAGV